MTARLDLGKLPRYKFVAHYQIGCADHNLPDCLCDVKIIRPTDIKTIPMFGDLAADAVGGVSAETFHEWASVLLGCHEHHRKLVIPKPTSNQYQGRTYGPGLGAWGRLPELNRSQLVKCYNKNVPWRDAKVWVPSGTDTDDFKVIAKTYNVRLVTARRKHNKEK